MYSRAFKQCLTLSRRLQKSTIKSPRLNHLVLNSRSKTLVPVYRYYCATACQPASSESVDKSSEETLPPPKASETDEKLTLQKLTETTLLFEESSKNYPYLKIPSDERDAEWAVSEMSLEDPDNVRLKDHLNLNIAECTEADREKYTGSERQLEALQQILEMKKDPEMDKQLRIMAMELEVQRQSEEQTPQIMKPVFWVEYISKHSRTAKRNYLEFLWKNEIKLINDRKKKIVDAIEREKRNNEMNQSRKEGQLAYGLFKNTMFMRIYDTSMNDFYHQQVLHSMTFGNKIILDCGFEEYMSHRELSNCVKQISTLININRVHSFPFYMQFVNFKKDNMFAKMILTAVPTLMNEEFPVDTFENDYLEIYDKKRLVYLTPHCNQNLEDFNPDDVYIIGAIVDKSKSEPLSMAKAKEQGIRMAKFPLDKYLDWGASSSKNLTLDQALNIMLDLQRDSNWQKALDHIPKRKLKSYRNYQLMRQIQRDQRLLGQDTPESFNAVMKEIGAKERSFENFDNILCEADREDDDYINNNESATPSGVVYNLNDFKETSVIRPTASFEAFKSDINFGSSGYVGTKETKASRVRHGSFDSDYKNTQRSGQYNKGSPSYFRDDYSSSRGTEKRFSSDNVDTEREFSNDDCETEERRDRSFNNSSQRYTSNSSYQKSDNQEYPRTRRTYNYYETFNSRSEPYQNNPRSFRSHDNRQESRPISSSHYQEDQEYSRPRQSYSKPYNSNRSFYQSNESQDYRRPSRNFDGESSDQTDGDLSGITASDNSSNPRYESHSDEDHENSRPPYRQFDQSSYGSRRPSYRDNRNQESFDSSYGSRRPPYRDNRDQESFRPNREYNSNFSGSYNSEQRSRPFYQSQYQDRPRRSFNSDSESSYGSRSRSGYQDNVRSNREHNSDYEELNRKPYEHENYKNTSRPLDDHQTLGDFNIKSREDRTKAWKKP